jgi:hypothetical protein
MKYLSFLACTILWLLLSSCDNNTIGKYTKEPLPDGFTYNVLRDTSNLALGKNETALEIPHKITEGQIATIAADLYKKKNRQERYYIFYLLPGMKLDAGAWASSHFDPELEIKILGFTSRKQERYYSESVEISNVLNQKRTLLINK